jgi:hypothetical protein
MALAGYRTYYYSQISVRPVNQKKGTFTAIKMALREKLDFLARML